MTLSVRGLWLVLLFVAASCGDRSEKAAVDTQENVAAEVDSTLYNLNVAIARNPRDPNAYYERARYWQDLDRVDDALADLKSALLLDTTNANYFYTLGELYFKIGALPEADEVLGVATIKNPKLAKAYVKRGEFAFYQKQYNSAIKHINDGLRQDVNYAPGYFWKGMVYLEQKNEKQAISGFLTAIEQDPDYHEAYMQLGLLYGAKNDNKAHDYFTNALRTDPKSIEARYARAMFLQDRGYADSARQDYRTILAQDSLHSISLFNLGYLSMMEEKYADAINWYTRSIESDPSYHQAFYNRGLCYELSGDKLKAANDFKRTLTLAPAYELAITALKRLK